MALSNSQYDQLMRTYEQRQLEDDRVLREHYDTAYAHIPELKELDDAISSYSIESGRRLLAGEADATAGLKEKIDDLSMKKQDLLVKAGYPADYLEEHYTCPDCRDTGYIGTEKCHCFKKAIVDLLYTQSNLPSILEEENFSTFSKDYYSFNYVDPEDGRTSRQAMETALAVCHDFVDTFGTEFRNLMLYGDTGVGKTFLSHCIAKELIDASYSVIYFSAANLFDCFSKNAYGKGGEQSDDTFEHIYDCDLLIIDDLGTEVPNFFTTSQLFNCLNERILRKKSTVISTNLTLKKFEETYSARIFSRISSCYTVLHLFGDDIRIQKKLQNLGGTKHGTP